MNAPELEGLHVIDASIMPRVPSANTHLAVIAFAERLSVSLCAADGGRGT